MGSTGIQPSTVTGKAPPWTFAPDGTIDLRTQDVDHRQRYSRNHDQRDDYGYGSNLRQQPYDNFVAAVTADRDRVVAGARAGRAMTFGWSAPDHRTDWEWKWQAPVGGALGLATFATAATLLSGVTRPGAAARALAPGAFWGVALLSGLAVGAGSFLALQHWFDGRHHDFHAPAAPTGTVEAVAPVKLPEVPDNVRKLTGTRAWGSDKDPGVVFGEPVGDLRGYDSRDAALRDMRGTMTVAAVRGSNDRTYLLQLRTDSANADPYYAAPQGLPARDVVLPFISRLPQLDYYVKDKVDDKVVQSELAKEFPNLSADVLGIEYPSGRPGSGEQPTATPAPIGIDIDHGSNTSTFHIRKRDGLQPEPVDNTGDHLLVGRWGQDAKTTGDRSPANSSYYGTMARDNEVIAGVDIGPGRGYATREEALGDIAQRPGDQVVFERAGRFHVYDTQDGAVLSGHDMVGLTTVPDHGGKPVDPYSYDDPVNWDSRKAGTPVALEEFGVTMLPHQGWWMTPGKVDAASKPKES